MIVTRHHLRTVPGFSRRPGFCSRGARAWFKRHNLSWSDFLRDGIQAETLLATGDAFAHAIVEHARVEASHGQR